MPANDAWITAGLWLAATIAMYAVGKRVHRRFGAWWTSPLILAPAVLLGVALLLHVGYGDYIRGPRLLVGLLAPATIAFAVPIYRCRALIARHWLLLLVGVLAGSTASMLSSWVLSGWLGLSGPVRLSLLPRSMSTPFAMTVSSGLGGVPALTAVFVLITGVMGASLGELLLNVLPIRSNLARGALFGLGAHGVGTARALQLDSEMGSIAGLVMVCVGLINVLAAPGIAHWLTRIT
ncbi:LrgB family protein [Mesoterricola silvestris]|uniref:Murein hydrolase effector protein LrgB n=1 Tax=Mesoterricola silvestris TaxID=2927979 RepID=A0AA48GU72_9BACT|nr:LrgB family protein [Mesoterricola silvestris]BDU71851.1 murein hydrolase effector protein LrgB [Mesoterricola silvestris]